MAVGPRCTTALEGGFFGRTRYEIEGAGARGRAREDTERPDQPDGLKLPEKRPRQW